MSTFRVCVFLIAAAALAGPARGQDKPAPPPGEHQHDAAPPPEQDHSQHMAAEPGQFSAREGSGTAWLPQATPMYALHLRAGAWELMGHGNVFAQYLHEAAEGDRGSGQGAASTG